jgi:hypothetical protein
VSLPISVLDGGLADEAGLTRYRYVLRNKRTGHVYLVVVFTPYLREDVDENGKLLVPEEMARRNAAAGRRVATPPSPEGVIEKDTSGLNQGSGIEDVD